MTSLMLRFSAGNHIIVIDLKMQLRLLLLEVRVDTTVC